MRFSYLVAALAALAACESAGDTGSEDASGAGGNGMDGAGNADGDCLTNAEEAARGTDPEAVDSDADGIDDCAEIACVSDPTDASERCYACGWRHNDPGDLVATGNMPGSVMGNMQLVDQCLEPLSLWDFATTASSPAPDGPAEYFILFMTAAW